MRTTAVLDEAQTAAFVRHLAADPEDADLSRESIAGARRAALDAILTREAGEQLGVAQRLRGGRPGG